MRTTESFIHISRAMGRVVSVTDLTWDEDEDGKPVARRTLVIEPLCHDTGRRVAVEFSYRNILAALKKLRKGQVVEAFFYLRSFAVVDDTGTVSWHTTLRGYKLRVFPMQRTTDEQQIL